MIKSVNDVNHATASVHPSLFEYQSHYHLVAQKYIHENDMRATNDVLETMKTLNPQSLISMVIVNQCIC